MRLFSPTPLRRAVLTGVLLLVTLLGALATARAVEHQERERFLSEADRLDVALAERFTAYVQVLRGGLGLFRASDDVTRSDWDTYVRSLRLDERYPGFKSISFAAAVPTSGLDRFVRDVRAEKVPARLGAPDALKDYALRDPEGSSGETYLHGPIKYVAPFTDVNQRVLGVDMMAEPTRRAVMQRAAATGHAVASTRLSLSGSANQEAGFIVYVPVKIDGKLLGWVTAAFLAESFTDGLEAARGTNLDLQVTDGPDGSGAVLFSSLGVAADGAPLSLPDDPDAAFVSTDTVEVPGGQWSVRHVARDGFVPLTGRLAPWLVGLLGLLAALVAWVLSRGSERWHSQTLLLSEQAVGLLDARDAAEGATRATSAFLATMSHEIRTPLNAVVGAASLLEDTPLDDEQRESTRVIASSGDHLLHVINGILDYSKLEAGRIDLEVAPFDPAACALSAIDLVAGEARTKGLTLTTDLDLPAYVLGDPARLRQVFVNLLANAVRFTPDGGSVTLSGRAAAEGSLAFAVVDTGVGISPDQRARLFEPFVQADASTSRTHGGTGLGLSIARRLVDAMGGVLDVESRPGEGARFHFSIRAAVVTEPAPTEPVPSSTSPIRTAPLRVLVAEDDEVNRLLIERMLVRLGHEPVLVADGAAAVVEVRGGDFDVVLLDLHMPVLDGVSAARAIVELGHDHGGPYLVAMTGSVSQVDLDAAAAAGMADVVTKPFVLDDLSAALTRSVAAASLR